MLLTPWVLVLAMQALPPCELPDLSASSALDNAYQTKALPGDVVGVAMADPTADDDALLSGEPEEPAPTRAHSAASVWLWSEASSWLLVPKGFEVSMAAVGVDGSWVIEMRDPKAPSERRLRASSTGACVGCAYSNGAAYFEEYAKAALENEFLYCAGLERPIVRDEAGEQRMRFHFDNDHGQRHDAVASIGGEDVSYLELVVSGLEGALRDEVLAAFAR